MCDGCQSCHTPSCYETARRSAFIIRTTGHTRSPQQPGLHTLRCDIFCITSPTLLVDAVRASPEKLIRCCPLRTTVPFHTPYLSRLTPPVRLNRAMYALILNNVLPTILPPCTIVDQFFEPAELFRMRLLGLPNAPRPASLQVSCSGGRRSHSAPAMTGVAPQFARDPIGYSCAGRSLSEALPP